MEKATRTGRKVYLIRSGRKITISFLGRKRNEPYITGSIKCLVDSSSNRFKRSMVYY